jgi:hypothetical protein
MYGTVLSGDAPSFIGDLRSVETDLRYAARLFARVAQTDPDADADARQAFYDAGAIAYRRGFTTGRSLVTKGQSRVKVPEEIIDALDSEGRLAHERVLERANTHIAHRVGDEEQGRLILLLSNPAIDMSVEGVTWFTARFVGPFEEEARQAADIAVLLADSVGALVESMQARLLEDAKHRNVEDLYANARPMGDIETKPADQGPQLDP